MKKAFFISSMAICVYLFFFTKEERKARDVLKKIPLLKQGMHKDTVIKLLSKPDKFGYKKALDYIDTAQMQFDSVLVWHYSLGIGSPDNLRIVFLNDTVYSITNYN